MMKTILKKAYLCTTVCVGLCTGFGLTGCDDGDIRPSSGEGAGNRNFTVTTRFFETDAWPEAYTLALAAYDSRENAVPLVKTTLSRPTGDGAEKIIYLANVPAQARWLAISLMKGSVRQYNYYTAAISNGETDITLTVEPIHLAGLSHIQQLVFDNNCSRCHGANGTPTAGLDLTAGHSFENLVNRPAVCTSDGTLRVLPGDAGKSFLHRMLTDSETEANRNGLNHTDMLDATDLIAFVASWINHGAENK